jgi:hypothetical protein
MNSEYLKSIIRDLTEVAWEEHGRGIRNRTTLVGVEYFDEKYGTKPVGQSVEETLGAVVDVLKQEGIISGAEYSLDDVVLKMSFQSCGHLQTEKQLMDQGVIGVVNCPCSNILMHFIGRCTGKYCELAGVEINDEQCNATIVVMNEKDQEA